MFQINKNYCKSSFNTVFILFMYYIMDYVNKALKYFEKSCTPSQVYLAIAVVSILFSILDNLMKKGKSNDFHVLGIRVPGLNALLVFVLQVLYVFAWSWFLNYLCKKGYTNISWFLVLLPYIGVLLAVILALVMMSRVKV